MLSSIYNCEYLFIWILLTDRGAPNSSRSRPNKINRAKIDDTTTCPLGFCLFFCDCFLVRCLKYTSIWRFQVTTLETQLNFAVKHFQKCLMWPILTLQGEQCCISPQNYSGFASFFFKQKSACFWCSPCKMTPQLFFSSFASRSVYAFF